MPFAAIYLLWCSSRYENMEKLMTVCISPLWIWPFHVWVALKPCVLGWFPVVWSHYALISNDLRHLNLNEDIFTQSLIWLFDPYQQHSSQKPHFAFALPLRHKGFGSWPSRSPTASSASRGPRPSSHRPTRRWKKPITLASCRPPRASTRGQTAHTHAGSSSAWPHDIQVEGGRLKTAHTDVAKRCENFSKASISPTAKTSRKRSILFSPVLLLLRLSN